MIEQSESGATEPTEEETRRKVAERFSTTPSTRLDINKLKEEVARAVKENLGPGTEDDEVDKTFKDLTKDL